MAPTMIAEALKNSGEVGLFSSFAVEKFENVEENLCDVKSLCVAHHCPISIQ